jgi:hypothetical protein
MNFEQWLLCVSVSVISGAVTTFIMMAIKKRFFD